MRASAPEEARQARAARGAFAEIFSSVANGCGHRRVAMCLRAEPGAAIADKTALKMMHGVGIRRGCAAGPTVAATAHTGSEWLDFESFKAVLDAYVVHWNTRRRRVWLNGPISGDFRSQPIAA